MVMQFGGQVVRSVQLLLFIQAAQIAALRQIGVMAVHLTVVLQRRRLSVLVGERTDVVLDPTVVDHLLGGEPAFDVDVQHGKYQVLRLHRRLTPVLFVELDLAAQYLIEQFVDIVRLTGEWRIAGQNDEHDHAGTPHVDLNGEKFG